MNKHLLSKEQMGIIKGMARYWNEVNERDSSGSTDITGVLYSELQQVVQRLGLTTLWIIEEYVKGCEEDGKIQVLK